MRIDASFLPEGVNTDGTEDGLFASFYPDGRLAYFGRHLDGMPVGWTLELDEHGGGVCRRVTEERYHPDEEWTLADWARSWIGRISSRDCEFCGKNQYEVRKLIAGPTCYICDECVQLCHEILSGEE